MTEAGPVTQAVQPWKLRWRLLAAVVSGFALTAAFPPLDQRWVAVIALVPLFAALRGARGWTGALLGAVAAMAFFGVLIYWISYFGYAAWIALVLLMVASWTAFGAAAARASTAMGTFGRLVAVPVLFAGFEVVRAWAPFGGFSWGSLGASQHSGGPTVHLARMLGITGVSLALAAVNALIAEAVFRRDVRQRASLVLVAGVILLTPTAISLGPTGDQPGVIDIAAVQGNVPRERFSSLARRGRQGPEDNVIIDNHVRLTKTLLADPPDLVVWPENAFDRDPRVYPKLFAPVTDVVRELNAPLLFGAILDAGDRFTNSNLLLTPNGGLRQRYDKRHLVPFGEYVPVSAFRKIVPALDRELPTDGIAGRRPVVFNIGGIGVGSVICFESTYPELIRDEVKGGAQVIVVSTNNASMGTSPAARQHLAMSRMRAIESGRTVVHAAIAGVSAIIEPDGDVLQRSELFTPAVLRAEIPLSTGQTFFTRYGSAIEYVYVLGALLLVLVSSSLRKRGGE
jgi:apolipoprotein N-acyltransferase